MWKNCTISGINLTDLKFGQGSTLCIATAAIYILYPQLVAASMLAPHHSYLVFVEACELLLSNIFVKSHGGAVWLNYKMNQCLFFRRGKSLMLAADSKHHLALVAVFTPGEAMWNHWSRTSLLWQDVVTCNQTTASQLILL